jgi:hypothetical protein
MVSKKKLNGKGQYGYLMVRKEAIEAFKACRDPDETRTATLMKLIKTYQESKNRKRPNCSDSGINQTIAENALKA